MIVTFQRQIQYDECKSYIIKMKSHILPLADMQCTQF
jgi:hypothetical protein